MPLELPPGLHEFLEQRAAEMRANPTKSEQWVWQILRDGKAGVEFQTQVPMLRYILDFYAPYWKLCVELDGYPHRTYQHSKDDKVRDGALKLIGITTLRLPSRLIFRSPQAVLRLVRYTAGVDMFPEIEYPRGKRKKQRRKTPYRQVWG